MVVTRSRSERFRGALEIDPAMVVAQLHLGEALLDLGRPDEAIAPLEAAAKSKAHAAAALAALGRAARDRGDAERARDLFEQALAAQPSADLLHHSIGLAYRTLGDEPRAKAELARAGAVAPSYPDAAKSGLDELRTTTGALLLRGSRALIMERPREAVEQYRRAVAAAPEDTEARRSLAMALRATGDLDGALRELEEAARLAPDDHVVLFDLGNVELARGAHQAAADAFTKCLALAPDFVPARFNLANAQLLLGQVDGSARQLRARARARPRPPSRALPGGDGEGMRRDGEDEGRAGSRGVDRGRPRVHARLVSARPSSCAAPAIARRRRPPTTEVLKRGGDVASLVDARLGLATLAGEESRTEVVIEHLQAAVDARSRPRRRARRPWRARSRRRNASPRPPRSGRLWSSCDPSRRWIDCSKRPTGCRPAAPTWRASGSSRG